MKSIVIYIGLLAFLALLFAGLVSVSDEPATIGISSGNDSFKPTLIEGPQIWNTSTNDKFTIRVSEGDKKKDVKVASVDIEKHTIGHDADVAPGPFVFVEPEVTMITWTYYVTNTGDLDLTDVLVTDNRTIVNAGPISGDDGDGILEPGETWVYNATDYAMEGQYSNLGTVTALHEDDVVSDEDPSHYYGNANPDPSIDIEKFTVGQNADAMPGPYIPTGNPVVWEYVVTNTGNVPLVDVNVTDDKVGSIGTISYLGIGETRTFNASGTAGEGPYSNLATVNASYEEIVVSDEDPSNYYGGYDPNPDPSIKIEKSTNGFDADNATGPILPVGSTVDWEYNVTNTGNVTLFYVEVFDDKEGFIGTSSYIGVGESRIFNASNVTIEGQYGNNATVTAWYGEMKRTAEDPSHYFGASASVDIEKSTNGYDADSANYSNSSIVPWIPVGENVSWNYTVTNTGNIVLTNINVTDDEEGFIGTIYELGVGNSSTLSAQSISVKGPYANIATAEAEYDGQLVNDTDPSHYLGITGNASLDIEKRTNGYHIFDPNFNVSSAFIPVGSNVTWNYTVTNTGNVTLTDINVTDDMEGFIGTIAELDVGNSSTLSVQGVADMGLYINNATAEATYDNKSVNDTDISAYFGTGPLVIEKRTNGYHFIDIISDPTPAFIPVGSNVTWNYTVTNTGNDVIYDINVTDDMEGFIGTIAELGIGNSTTLSAQNLSVEGLYMNTASVEGTYDNQSVSSTDLGIYFGINASIDIEKCTNGHDNDTAPGMSIPVGQKVTWTYNVTNNGNIPLFNITVTDDKEGFIGTIAYLGVGEFNNTLSASNTSVEGQYNNTALATADVMYLNQSVNDSDSSHYFGDTNPEIDPSIDIEKSTIGQDADFAPGPIVPVGTTVIWEYTVTNIGNVPLLNVNVTDDKEGFIGNISYLGVGESHTFNESGTATGGQYSNLANVTATYEDVVVGDEDPGNYYGDTDPEAEPSVNIKKFTVGQDADTAPGPTIPVGSNVTWEYNITNTGNVPLFNLTVTDDEEGFIGNISYLGVGDLVTLNATGVSEEGQYSNVGNVTAEYGNIIVSDEDPGHYFGGTDPNADPSISIEKHTNGQDADTGSGPTVPVGNRLVWEYIVTNTGNVTLFDVTVTDDKEGFVASIPYLYPGQSKMLYEYGVVISEGQYSNIGSVSAKYGSTTVNDNDPSHYYGGPRPDADPSIHIEKTTNGYDADRGRGPTIPVGSDVVWEYKVTNTGDVTLFNVRVYDDEEGYIGTIRYLHAGQSRTLDEFDKAEEGQYSNVGSVSARYGSTTVRDSDPSHYYGGPDPDADPSISIEKHTNGYDADRGRGPSIQTGSDVVWEYTVTNTGDVTLFNVRVYDNREGYIGSIRYLHPGQSRTLDEIGEAEEGQYSNVGRAYARYYRSRVSDSDPSHYYGTEVDAHPSLHIEKTTNGYDADRGTGPRIQVGSDVVWEYKVTNTGDVTLRGVRVYDSEERYIGYISYLHPGQSRTLHKIGEAEEGQYSNVGRAYARYYRSRVSDTDPSHYYGTEVDAHPSLHIEKTTNGYDADRGTGPRIQVGSDVVWEYKVTNTGDVTLRGVRIYDSEERYIGYISYLHPGQSRTLDKIGEAEEGQYSNVGRAYARYYRSRVSDTDPSHYYGTDVDAHPSLHIEKTTNGYDADSATGPRIQVGSDVVWEYKVTNTGDVTLRYIRVYDDEEGYVGTIRYLHPGQSRTLDKIGEAEEGQYSNVGTARARYYRGYVGDSDPSHYYGTDKPDADPSIVIEKYTNGKDADAGTGPTIPVGSNVVWEYKVKNTGNVTLFAVEVGDDEEGYIDTISYLNPGQSKTLQKRGVSEEGQYSNTGYVSGIYDSSIPFSPLRVLDNDPSHYFGGPDPNVNPSVTIEKTTNGVDADTGTGPVVPVGAPVVWEYTVTNTGNVTLFAVEIGDDEEGYIDTVPFLHPGQSQKVDKSSISEEGQYSNTGYVSGIYDSSTPFSPLRVLDNDPSHYLGSSTPVPNPSIRIEKSTNGLDADAGTGPDIPVGSPVVWEYNVTNTGNVTLLNIQVTDDKEGYIGSIPYLHAGQSYTFNETNVSVEGQYSNIANVSGMYGFATLIDSDSSHYLGVAEHASLRIEKYTNGHDADIADVTFAPSIPVDDIVTWNYTVYNDGNVPLNNIIVTDDKEGYIGTIAELQIGETNSSLSAQNISVEGWYSNLATANTTYDNHPVNDTDPSHYLGYYNTASLDIVKFTNGGHANDPFYNPNILVGDTVTWNYSVTNNGNAVLYDITVIDDKEGYIGTIAELQIGETNSSLSAQNISMEGFYSNNVTANTTYANQPVNDTDSSYYFGVSGPGDNPSLTIEKATNGHDADTAPGPSIDVGDTVTWTYVVTNDGDVPLANINVTDDKEGLIGTIAYLDVGESNSSLSTSNTSVAGQYSNIATAETEYGGQSVNDTDPSHYIGVVIPAPNPSIQIEKTTNGVDADNGTGPDIRVGHQVNWEYNITNNGNVPLSDINVTDDKEGFIGTISYLGVGESHMLNTSGIATEGQYSNRGYATAFYGSAKVVDTDSSHYYGVDGTDVRLSIDIQKSTNGHDADCAPGPSIPVGLPVIWTYNVTNYGNVDLANVNVTDNMLAVNPVLINNGDGDSVLEPGESWVYTASGIATFGPYVNVGNVSAIHRNAIVFDEDPSYYTGFEEIFDIATAENH